MAETGDTALAFLRALEAGDFEALERLTTEDFTFAGLAPQPLDRGAFLELERGFHAALSEVSYAPRLLAERGDEAEVAIVVSGRQTAPWALPGLPEPLPATGRGFRLPEQRPVYTVRDGRVARAVIPPVEGAGVDSILAQLRGA